MYTCYHVRMPVVCILFDVVLCFHSTELLRKRANTPFSEFTPLPSPLISFTFLRAGNVRETRPRKTIHHLSCQYFISTVCNIKVLNLHPMIHLHIPTAIE